jgi:hypothetical protein
MPRKRSSPPSAGLIPGQPISAENLTLVHHQVVQAWVQDDIRGELRIPPDVAVFRLQLGPALAWIDHTFDLVGTPPPPPQTTHDI